MAHRGTLPLPKRIEDITASWLTWALDESWPGTVVKDVSVLDVLPGTTSKAFIHLEYERRGNPDLPNRLCIKGEFDRERLGEAGAVATTGTQIEALFYRDLARTLDIPTLRIWFAGSEPGMGILIMDDLRGNGTVFGDPLVPLAPDRVAEGLALLARLHAATWRRDFADTDWVTVGSPAIRQYAQILFSEANWNERVARIALPADLSDRSRVLGGLHRLWQHDDGSDHVLVHGDPHLGNTCTVPHRGLIFMDWAGLCLAPWAHDVAYFLAGALSVEDRRRHEDELLAGYLGKFHSLGGPQIAWAEATREVALHHLYGFIWAMLPAPMQPEDAVSAMTERYVAAITEHRSLHLLEGVGA